MPTKPCKVRLYKNNKKQFKTSLMCEVLNVNRSAYYNWASSQPSEIEKENKILSEKIKTIFHKHKGNYGTRRIKHILKRDDYTVSRRRIGKLMKKLGLRCKIKRKFKLTTDSNHNKPISPNLLNRNFKVDEPNKVFTGDITYIRTKQGSLYLAIVMDIFSRKIVGWSMKKHMKSSLVNDALLMAIWKRKPKAGLIWHTDRGSQYADDSHRFILKQHNIIQSMSRKGNCWDNAVSESFFHTLKSELIYDVRLKTIEEAKIKIFEYIESYYNRYRLHSSNDYLSPEEYEGLLEKL